MADPNQPLPPPAQLLQLMMGAWVTQTTGTLARLGVCDHVEPAGTSSEAIAAKLGLSPAALFRVMRAGVMIGLFRKVSGTTFTLTPVGELLRSDSPMSMRALLDAETAPGHWLPWGRLDEVVRRGASVAGEALGGDVWDYYAKHPAEGRAFAEGMSGMSGMALAAIGAAWTPPRGNRVVDVGGSHGAFLHWVLGKLPGARGVLFDRANVIEGAQAAQGALASRVECVAGDFLQSVPMGDLYLLKHIVHDWSDDEAVAILRNVRAAMAPGATVVIVEMVVPEDGTPSPAILLDLNMMVMLTGRERTVAEMGELLTRAGLKLGKVTPTMSPFVVLEAQAA